MDRLAEVPTNRWFCSLGCRDELKHFLERLAEHMGDPERDLERRRILAALDRVDRLPGDADLVGELLLRHFAELWI